MMPFIVEWLWSDVLVWLLVVAVIGFAVYTRNHPHLRAPWARVARSASGMAAATVLLVFVLVGLLDSLHYRAALPQQGGKTAYATEVRSVLDRVLQPLRATREKTYSAPLATHLYAKETVQQQDGTEARVFPRLRHGGAHLKDPEADWCRDVLLKAFRGLSFGLLLVVCHGDSHLRGSGAGQGCRHRNGMARRLGRAHCRAVAGSVLCLGFVMHIDRPRWWHWRLTTTCWVPTRSARMCCIRR